MRIAAASVGAFIFLFSSCTTITDARRDVSIEYFRIAQAYDVLDKTPEAVGFYEKALEYNTWFSEARFALARLYIDDGDFDKAEELLLSISVKKSDASLNKLRAYLYARKGYFTEAKNLYTKILETGTDVYDVYYNLGVISLEEADTEGARSYFLESLSLKKDYVPSAHKLAEIYIDDDDFVSAVLVLKDLGLSLTDYPAAAITLGEGYYGTESFAELFLFVETLRKGYGDSPQLTREEAAGYQALLWKTAGALAEIALDDKRALEYFTEIHEMGFVGLKEWDQLYLDLYQTPRLPETKEFIKARIDEAAPASREETEEETPQTQDESP